MNTTRAPRLLSKKEAAFELATSEKTIDRLRREGQLVSLRVRGAVKITRESLEAYIQRQVALEQARMLVNGGMPASTAAHVPQAGPPRRFATSAELRRMGGAAA